MSEGNGDEGEFPVPLEHIEEAFELLPDWTEKYRFIIDLGRQLPALASDEMVEANKVEGCMSQVWLVGEQVEAEPPRLRFRADSDAHIVKGLIAILMSIFSDKPAREIVQTDAKAILDGLGLAGHLSIGRRNGLESMVARIKELAAAAA